LKSIPGFPKASTPRAFRNLCIKAMTLPAQDRQRARTAARKAHRPDPVRRLAGRLPAMGKAVMYRAPRDTAMQDMSAPPAALQDSRAPRVDLPALRHRAVMARRAPAMQAAVRRVRKA